LDKIHILNKYKDFIFEIQTNNEGFFIYQLKDLDFIPHDEEVNQDQLYLIFESLSKEFKEIIFEVNLGVDVLAIFNKVVGHFKKTIRVECTDPEFEFTQESCLVLKDILVDLIKGNESFLNDASIDSIKTLEPYYFNNIRFI
jgi:hypothetical protein